MHELAICEAVLQQAISVAQSHGTRRVVGITLQIGPLAGVEPALLRAAFPLAASGTACEHAELLIDLLPVIVQCAACRTTSTVTANKLLCAECGAWRVQLVSGDELRLASIELLDDPLLERKAPCV